MKENEVKQNTLPLMDLSWMKFEFIPQSFSVTSMTYHDGFHSLRHNHDFAQIIYCRSGNFTHTIGNNVYKCETGSLSVVSPGVFHILNISSKAELTYINISYNAFSNMNVKEYASSIALVFFSNFCNKQFDFKICEYFDLKACRKPFENVLGSVIDASLQNKSDKNTFVLLEKLFSTALPLTCEQINQIDKLYNTRLRPIIAALDYLNTHYAQKIHCDDVLRAVSLCNTDFYNYFKQFLGTTYSVYLQMVRVSRAHRAISFTKYSLSYIANMCGFGDNAYMTKCYKKYKGFTPTEERMRHNIENPKYAHLKISHSFFDTKKK